MIIYTVGYIMIKKIVMKSFMVTPSFQDRKDETFSLKIFKKDEIKE